MSREKKFTPGPWESCEDDHGEFEKHIDLPNADFYIHGEGDELAANANLIAAAPELLEVLENVDEVICQLCKRLNPQHEGCSSCEDRELLVSAIKKAYGE